MAASRFYRGIQILSDWGQIRLDVNRRFTVITVCNWETYQSEGVEERTASEPPVNRQRTASEPPVKLPILREEGNKERREEVSVPPPTRFSPPTVDQVREYCRERGNAVDPEAFLSHYQSNGWKVGKNSMKDWRAAVRTWEKNEGKFGKSQNGFFDQTTTSLQSFLDEEDANAPQ